MNTRDIYQPHHLTSHTSLFLIRELCEAAANTEAALLTANSIHLSIFHLSPSSTLHPPPPDILIMPATTAETLSLVTRNVSVAPLVLLSAADHYGRSAKGTRKRVVGVLLGQNDGKNVRVSNSFAGEQTPLHLPLILGTVVADPRYSPFRRG